MPQQTARKGSPNARKSVSVAAVDMGATSGRVFSVRWDGVRMDMTEAHRFTHGFERLGKHFYWQPGNLYREIVNGLQAAQRDFPTLVSCGVDFWGVDHALVLKDGRLAHPVYAYRDQRTRPFFPGAKSERAKTWYSRTGIPPVMYNTSIQLAETLQAMPCLRESVDRCLLLPDYINYLLSGSMLNEVSISSTTQLLDLNAMKFSKAMFDELEIPSGWFYGPALAGRSLSTVRDERGLKSLRVSLVPGHDTSCAFEGAPGANSEDFIVSTGTWCLAGCFANRPFPVEAGLSQGISHERCGDGRYRPTRTHLGLWLVEKLLESFQAKPVSADEWIQLHEAVAEVIPPEFVLDLSDEGLFNPRDMREAIDRQITSFGLVPLTSLAGYLRLAVESISQEIADSLHLFEAALDKRFKRILMIGGGARNPVLCQAISKRAGRSLHAFPIEAAIIGNAAYQLKALDVIESVAEFRLNLVEQVEPRIFC